MLRLNVALASDPAANPDAKDLKKIGEADAVAAEFAQQQLAALNMAIGGPPPPPPPMRKPALKGPEGLVGPLALPAVVELPPRLPMFVCGPCGIRFSSASTLEAHQTYYCSHRKETEDGGGGAGGGTGSTAGTGGSASGGSIGGSGTKNAHPGGDGSGEPPAKAAKTGKQYACSQCSYSADKKVSLNRHMRMHQSSPTPSSVNGDDTGRQQQHQQHHHQQQQQQLQLIQAQAVAAAAAVLHQQQQQQQLQPQPVGQAQAPPPQVDRYCSDCDIRFSSTKTYRAHKQHYCSSRHREGQQSNNSTPKPGSTQKSGSQSPPEVPKTPPVAAAQQPFLALPTNPIIVIPYSLIRGASVIPGLLPSLAPGVANPESACFIFQNGTLQPIAMSLASQVAHQAATSAGGHAEVGPGPQRPPSQQHPSRGTTPSVSNENSSHSTQGAGPTPGGAPSSTGEVLKALNKRENSANKEATLTSTTTPLDLSVRRFSPGAIGALRERSLSLSSAVSGDQRMDYDSLMEGKENLSVSGDSLTPEQIVCAPSLPGSPPLTPSPKRRSNSPRATGPGPMASNAALAAAAAAVAGHHAGLGPAATLSLSPMTLQQQLMRPLLPADIALRLSADPSVCSLNLSILAAPGGATPHPLLTPKQSVELALRLSTPVGDGKHPPQQISPLLNSISPTAAASGGASVLPSGAAPQIFVKQGDSKCKECNIVFCKYENYLAHKKHYCSARNQDDGGGGGGEGAKVSPPISPQTGTSPSAGAPLSTVGGGPRPPVGTGVAYQQLICAACGIKFTSLDNLTAHQMYYCPKRIDVGGPVVSAPEGRPSPQPHKERCSKCKSIHEPGQPCTVAGHGAYKCPICEVISPNSTEARRHMDTHGGVKAFRCTICRYKGNTLRGMRTHIRMHFDKKTSEFNEENYITCILEEDGIEIPPAGAQNAAAVAAAAAALASATHKFLAQDGSGPPDVAGSPVASVRHHCELCPFTTSDRVNMIKHIKQVHGGGRSVPFGLDSAELYNGIAAGAVVELAVRPPIASTPGPGSSSTSSSLIKTEPIDDRSPSPSGGDQDTTTDINVDVCLEETAPVVATTVKTEAIDPHMPSLNSPLAGSPSPPSSLNLKPKSQTPTKTTAGDAISSSLVRRSDTPTRAKTPSPPVPPTPLTLEHLPPGPKYCDTCDITFNYAKTYIAHKNFYCKAVPLAGGSAPTATGQPAAGTGRRSASVSPNGGATSPAVTVAVNRATETSV
ncbi:zinc finger protein ush [Anopheles cruzii]|uniref:zinc finger protein ush n=1 Tax=Anopheles cruzii TaxID=68878 RepID=UPI0022EC856C|nr:zinc finger protein ush [Anopheles cruzii]